MVLMTELTHVIELPPISRPLTVDDLERTPADGRRYELIDGVLIVSPGVARPHQRVAMRLAMTLEAVCPRELEVLSPFTLRLGPGDELIPDLGVVPTGADPPERYPRDLLLAVEVLSPSSRRIDMVLKRQVYADAGVRAYWVIDPEVPSLIAWELVEGRFVERARVRADEEFSATRPFPVTVVPGRLVVR